MANENLAEQLNKLKAQLVKWQQELTTYKQWALNNDGVISKTEQAEIDRRGAEIAEINARIAQIEKAKGLASEQPTEVPQTGKIPSNFVRLKDKEVTPELSKAAVKYLNLFCAKYPAAERAKHYGEFIIFKTTDGKEFLAHFEVHTVYGADPKKPQVPHPSIGLFKNINNDQAAGTGGEGAKTPTENTSGTISASVGSGGVNKAADVKLVQTLLNKHGYGLSTDGDCGKKTIAAIMDFQSKKAGFSKPDGLVSPGGKTWQALNGGQQNNGQQGEQTNTTTTVTPNTTLTGQVGKGKANKPGDVAAIQQLLNTHGYKFTVDGIFTEALSNAIKAFQKDKVGAASPDGVVDPGGKTWKTLKGEKVESGNSTPTGPLNKPNWIKIAEGEIGQKEKAGNEHNPRIVEYHSTTGKSKDDETAWCSSFVNWVMGKAGQGGTNSAMAISWAKWGKKVNKPAYGAIAVIDWDGPGPGWKGHVGFVVGMKGTSILLLGGNQSNAVNISSFGTSKVIAYVYPSNFEIPDNFYTFGEVQGEFGEDTDISNTR